MVTEKTTGRKKAAVGAGGAGGEGEASSGAGDTALRTVGDPRRERRYEPKASAMALVSVVAMSIGGLLVGAGTFGQWFRNADLGPHPYAPYLLAAGAVLLIGVALFGGGSAKPVRVGDAGVGLEESSSEVERVEWRDITRIALTANALTVSGPGTALSIPTRAQPQAVARIVAEAKSRIPKLAGELDAGGLDALDEGQGELVTLEPPQVAGARCKKTDKIIAFEKDARLCGRCGETYHKDSVPKSCLTCGAKLKA